MDIQCGCWVLYEPREHWPVTLHPFMSALVVSGTRWFLEEYLSSTLQCLKLLDIYLLYKLLTRALQFTYCLLMGTFPFNTFLLGFTSWVGSFILVVCLRIQVNPQNEVDFEGISLE
ncbi:dolichyl-diphosphooligosaccharide--protein glycosyltransferase subunit DAD1-like [Pan paniscus]|uniref:dolichyl-diphosphooligosaccharide--protein glycosyltransferase subunit DAD1-like n=1 Tax=Pan paniscus TaxID=9597 RepID=UPI0015604330|nr:dolichyl-diphosphooligosaccharide--protein glycosyltransferase subunit DAD1-like [Pan paniscus]XP_054520428.1 dolichyl-diphosphooligosaccharide--protein glycosyltransferase subunit DAD1-like [Pan troglodytes]